MTPAAFAREYLRDAGGARPGTCYPLAWQIRERYGWPIVKTERDGGTHFVNVRPDGSTFDGWDHAA